MVLDKIYESVIYENKTVNKKTEKSNLRKTDLFLLFSLLTVIILFSISMFSYKFIDWPFIIYMLFGITFVISLTLFITAIVLFAFTDNELSNNKKSKIYKENVEITKV
jgi:uncharacterized membrane protein